MDLPCLNCGEPWDMDYVVHEEPEAFVRRGGKITSCPACDGQPDIVFLDTDLKAKLEGFAAVADLLGDDLDGYAAFVEDIGG